MANYGWRELGWISDRLNSEFLPKKIFSERETPTSRYLGSALVVKFPKEEKTRGSDRPGPYLLDYSIRNPQLEGTTQF